MEYPLNVPHIKLFLMSSFSNSMIMIIITTTTIITTNTSFFLPSYIISYLNPFKVTSYIHDAQGMEIKSSVAQTMHSIFIFFS